MCLENRPLAEQVLEELGEERIRYTFIIVIIIIIINIIFIIIIIFNIIRRGGRILDVARDGYYNSEMCIEDFDEVNTYTHIYT